MTIKHRITTGLWFDSNAEEAAQMARFSRASSRSRW